MADYARAHGRVSGRVQGVSFRYFTQDSAAKHDLTGWVKNLPDGRVEFLAEGQKGMLDSFLKDVSRGPVAAHVSDLKVNWEKYTGEFDNFRIKF